ncbi:MAG TPA: N-acetyltransferase [Verrucomicrobiae bacterium]|nr:N-acetyltransferase [Verrucomicrobiae bacterium]
MHRQFRIRPVKERDLDPVLLIEHAGFGKDAYDRKLFAEYCHKCGDLFLAAESGRRIWGYSLTCIRGERAELVSIATLPAARRTGVASALLDSTLRRLRRRNVAHFSLMVRQTNREAIRFYEKFRFQKVRNVFKYYEDGGDGVLMRRILRTESQV